jgi:hypothetical protein
LPKGLGSGKNISLIATGSEAQIFENGEKKGSLKTSFANSCAAVSQDDKLAAIGSDVYPSNLGWQSLHVFHIK